jgi:hypothetical protein
VADRLQREAETPLSSAELDLAYRAALASCREETAREVAPAEPTQSDVQRFLAGPFSMDQPPAKKRVGRYRYIEKDRAHAAGPSATCATPASCGP